MCVCVLLSSLPAARHPLSPLPVTTLRLFPLPSNSAPPAPPPPPLLCLPPQVREGLVPLIAAIRAKPDAVDDAWIKGSYETETQAELCK